MTKLSLETPSLPTYLPPRYEIRRLRPEHRDWISAIVIHSNLFCGSIFPKVYPENIQARAYGALPAAKYLVEHQIESGHSFGIFDLEYEYKTEEAKKAGGKLLWDFKNTDITSTELLRQMDFPLVSVAMAYDGINALDMGELMNLIAFLPCFGTIYHTLEGLDLRKPEDWKPNGPNEVLLRNATSTRADYEGQGLMKKLAQFLMRYAAEQGFRGIQIECIADAVTHVWSKPPAPFKGSVVSEFNTWEYEEDEEVDGQKTGKKINPFQGPPPKNEIGRQRVTKVYAELKPYTPSAVNGHANGTA